MRILMVVAYWLPEIGSGAHLYYDLAKEFVKHGHKVHVITSYPRKYNMHESDIGKRYPMDEVMDGISVHRCTYPLSRRDLLILRGLEHFILPHVYYRRFKKLNMKFDVVLIYIPPLPLYNLGEKIRRKTGTPYVLNFQDIHPDELTDVGVLKNRLVIYLLKRLEKKAYRDPDYITVMSPNGVELIKQRGGRKENIECIYNSINMDEIEKYRKIKTFKKKEGIEDKFLVTYAGILSPFQGLDDILDVAKEMKEHEDIMFYIVGDGMIRKKLEERVKEEKIHNARVLGLQPRDVYFDIINSSDVDIVSLDRRMTAPCVPGKLVNLLGLGKPVIANVPPTNDTARIVKEYNCGIVVQPGNIEEFKRAVLKLKNDKKLREEMSRNGIKFVEEKMNLTKNVKRYEEIFKMLVERVGDKNAG